MDEEAIADWAAWSREAVRLMQERNAAWQQRFGLSDCPFQWDMNTATIQFRRNVCGCRCRLRGWNNLHR